MNNSYTTYNDYACIDPLATVMEKPWFPRKTICPCNPKYDSRGDRGFVSCPLGISMLPGNLNEINLKNMKENNNGSYSIKELVVDNNKVVTNEFNFPKDSSTRMYSLYELSANGGFLYPDQTFSINKKTDKSHIIDGNQLVQRQTVENTVNTTDNTIKQVPLMTVPQFQPRQAVRVGQFWRQ